MRISYLNEQQIIRFMSTINSVEIGYKLLDGSILKSDITDKVKEVITKIKNTHYQKINEDIGQFCSNENTAKEDIEYFFISINGVQHYYNYENKSGRNRVQECIFFWSEYYKSVESFVVEYTAKEIDFLSKASSFELVFSGFLGKKLLNIEVSKEFNNAILSGTIKTSADVAIFINRFIDNDKLKGQDTISLEVYINSIRLNDVYVSNDSYFYNLVRSIDAFMDSLKDSGDDTPPSNPNPLKEPINPKDRLQFKHVICADVYEHIKTLANCSVHTTFCDPPYFLGTQWEYVNGVLQMKGQGKDFMSGSKGSWSVNNADWWRAYFKEIYRVMKYGGYVVFYSISQQSWAFSALMIEAGFEKCQELHWANISNFPKASDASKAVDRKVGAVREVVKENPLKVKNKLKEQGNAFGVRVWADLTAPATDLAKLFEGYKYGLAPLKKITEPILVFRKPCKNGSVLNDLMQCQNDNEISPAVLDIKRNRVGTEGGRNNGANNTSGVFNMGKYEKADYGGRFPATLFISPEAAELLDSQLDVITFEINGKIYNEKRLEYQRLVSLHVLNNTFESCKVLGVKREVLKASEGLKNINGDAKFWSGKKPEPNKMAGYSDSGYISRVLHQPDFNEDDYASIEYAMNNLCQYSKGIVEDTIYCPTVSPKERNEGLENMPSQKVFGLKEDTPDEIKKQIFSLLNL